MLTCCTSVVDYGVIHDKMLTRESSLVHPPPPPPPVPDDGLRKISGLSD